MTIYFVVETLAKLILSFWSNFKMNMRIGGFFDRIWEFEINRTADANPFGESGLKYIINKLMLSAFDLGLV
jgi:hypothetical protein